jgi:hypothetical protein
MSETLNSSDIMLSCVRGMLGETTPNIRSIDISYEESCIHLYFYFDGPISEENREDLDVVETEVITDFLNVPNISIESHYIRIDYPERVPWNKDDPNRRRIYHRKETLP